MTAGPTEVPGRVREAMAHPIANPDVDPAFLDTYRSLSADLASVYGTDDDVTILGGEGVLGLEAAVAPAIEPGDRVLCVANGLYGEFFAEFVESYGGNPTVRSFPPSELIDPDAVGEAIDDARREDEDFAAATFVHCETPTGTTNDLDEALARCREAGVLTIVDAVSSLGGTPVPASEIDLCIGASQKCFSAPPGLTTVAVSDAAWERIAESETRGLYTDLGLWRDVAETGEFPYTHLASNCYGFAEAVSMVLDEGLDNVYSRHEEAARHCRELGAEIGLDTYPSEGLCSPTVTAFAVEDALSVQKRLREEHDILVGTGLADMENDLIRIGHMGYSADVERVGTTMDALGTVLDDSDGDR
jgi:aspartate aminotransferase-like enzyme